MTASQQERQKPTHLKMMAAIALGLVQLVLVLRGSTNLKHQFAVVDGSLGVAVESTTNHSILMATSIILDADNINSTIIGAKETKTLLNVSTAISTSSNNVTSHRANSSSYFQTFDQYIKEHYNGTEDYYTVGKWLAMRDKCTSKGKKFVRGPKKLIQDGMKILQAKHYNATTSNIIVHERAAICAIHKMEDLYLHEWINYHLALGFDDIYLFDDNDYDTQGGESILPSNHPHIHVIPVKHLPERVHKQSAVYDSCIQIIKGREAQDSYRTTWAIFLDIDEFIALQRHESIQDFVQDYCPLPMCASLGLNWHWFGTSNQTYYSNQPVTQRFVHRDPTRHVSIKSIFRVHEYFCATNAHFAHLKSDPKAKPPLPPYAYTTEGRLNLQGPTILSSQDFDEVAGIYHYTKSLEEWYTRRCLTGDVRKHDLRCTGVYPGPGQIQDTRAADTFQSKVLDRQSPYADRFVSLPDVATTPSLQWTHHNESEFGIQTIVPASKVTAYQNSQ